MLKSFLFGALTFALSIVNAQNTATSASAVAAAAATALTRSPTSSVKGKAFNRFVTIWFENTNYELADLDPNFSAFAAQGIKLTNYYGITHCSQPNYVAVHSGDNFGLDNDNFQTIPANISTVIDLLEDKGISWGLYQEKMPYSGFEGYAWINQTTGQNEYVRKHNPAVVFNSNSNNVNYLAQMKNFSMFYADLEANTLPQWLFITPSMQDDGHDTDVNYAGIWLNEFLTPLLTDPNFMDDTLILIVFDEAEVYAVQNQVLGILLGDSVPTSLIGTSDSSYYNHYSQLSTVQANWGLHTLGRWDMGANVFAPVAAKTGDAVRSWTGVPALSSMNFNDSYAGPLNSANSSVGWPVPNTKGKVNKRTVLPAVAQTWGAMQKKHGSFYTTGVQIPDGQHPPPGYIVSYTPQQL